MRGGYFLRESRVLLYSVGRDVSAWLALAKKAVAGFNNPQLKAELLHFSPVGHSQTLVKQVFHDAEFDHVGAVVCGAPDYYAPLMAAAQLRLRPRFESRVVARELGVRATVLSATQRVELIVVEPDAEQVVSNLGRLGSGVHIAFGVKTETQFCCARPAMEKAGFVQRIVETNPVEGVRVAFYDGPLGRVEILWRYS